MDSAQTLLYQLDMNNHNHSLDSSALKAELGRVLSGRYRVDSLIAKGCMGAVFSSWDIERSAPCAVKLLLPKMKNEPQVLQRFADEARLLSQLCHPNIVEVFDHDQDPDGTLYLVMELLAGTNLDEVLRKHGCLPLPLALSIVKQVGSALHTAHLAGMVHRDIKPANIILLDADELSSTRTVKVIDFGLAKLADQRRAPRRGSDGMFIGTPAYLPPEAWNRVSADVDARTDQWGLAVVAYLMLSGHLPFKIEDSKLLRVPVARTPPPTLTSLVPQLPGYIQDAVARALSPDKEQRFPTVLDFVRALHKLPSASPIGPTGHGPPIRSAEPTQLLAHLLAPMAPPPSSSRLDALVATALSPRGAPMATVVSAAGDATPMLASLDSTVPGLGAEPRWPSLGRYLPAVLSLMGAVIAWGSVLWWWAWMYTTIRPLMIPAALRTSAASLNGSVNTPPNEGESRLVRGPRGLPVARIRDELCSSARAGRAG